MSKTQTPAEFEAAARRTIQEKETLIQSITQVANALEVNLAMFASSPSSEGLAEAIQNEIELAARKSLSVRIKNQYRAESTYQNRLNSEEGKSVLQAHLDSKVKIVAGLEKQIPLIRKEAIEKEEKGDDAHFELNDRADDLALLVQSHKGLLSTVEQALPRFPASLDSTVNYVELRNRLDLIQP